MANNVCGYCKHLCDVNREVAPDRGWCPVWREWQKITAKACKCFEQKEIPPRNTRRQFVPRQSQKQSAYSRP